ncbi:MAG TPA: CDP-alcohol phosphatidyltransferase [Anaerolineaceae bacterium]|nr:CDP-alcohol phosphatidyltransferase [Anaerolineaceae bacterium]
MKDGKVERKNDILLGPIERPVLNFLAKHMPDWVNSDMLTVLGVLGSALTLVSGIMAGRTGGPYQNPWILALCLGFVINWFGDSLDGTLARYRHKERPNFGYFIDHSVDGFTAVCMFFGFGFAGISSVLVAALGAIGYLLMMITVYLKTHVTGVFEMTTIKIGPTELRILAIIFSLVHYFLEPAPVRLPFAGGEEIKLGTLLVGVIAAILFVYYVVETIRVGRRLAIEDGKRLEQRLAKEAKEVRKQEKKMEKELKKSSKKANEKNALGDISRIN